MQVLSLAAVDVAVRSSVSAGEAGLDAAPVRF